MRGNELDAAIAIERKQRIAHWRSMERGGLLKLPEIQSEVVDIIGKQISFTTFREEHNRRLLILVRSDRPRFFGIVSYGATDGFWVFPDGKLTEVSNKDVLDFFS